jgi:hypothetical protein
MSIAGNGVHPKVASERLGHGKVAITLDLYSHVIPGMQEDAALVDIALKLAIQKRLEKQWSQIRLQSGATEQTQNQIDL